MGKILVAKKDGVHMLKFVGDVRLTLGPTIATYMDQLNSDDDFRSVIIDLTETVSIDSTALGLIAKIGIRTREQFDSVTTIIAPNADIKRVLESMAMQLVCLVIAQPVEDDSTNLQLPQEVASEASLKEQVLEAHRTLMSMNEDNYQNFKELVEALENETTEPPMAKTG